MGIAVRCVIHGRVLMTDRRDRVLRFRSDELAMRAFGDETGGASPPEKRVHGAFNVRADTEPARSGGPQNKKPRRVPRLSA